MMKDLTNGTPEVVNLGTLGVEMIDVYFDETVATVDAWYDPHTKLWVIQKLNKEGFQVGDATIVHGKKDAMRTKKEIETECGI